MRIGEARALAAAWVLGHARGHVGYRGAYLFSSDITPVARGIAIDGSKELVNAGLHGRPSSG